MIELAAWKIGSKAVWSVAGFPSVPEQRASTTDDFPKRSSLTRETGVLVESIALAEATADALSSIEICIRSLGSRTRSTSVSTIFFESTLNEYWTLLNRAATTAYPGWECSGRVWNARAPLHNLC